MAPSLLERAVMQASDRAEPWWRRMPNPIWLFLFGAFVLIGAFFLIEEHRAHALGALPYVLALAAMFFCIFGHRHSTAWHDSKRGDR